MYRMIPRLLGSMLYVFVYVSSRVQPLSQILIQRLTDLREDLKGQLSLHDDMQVELSALKTVISRSWSWRRKSAGLHTCKHILLLFDFFKLLFSGQPNVVMSRIFMSRTLYGLCMLWVICIFVCIILQVILFIVSNLCRCAMSLFPQKVKNSLINGDSRNAMSTTLT